MESILKFFLTKTRLNYTAFLFMILLGIYSYQTIPKDIFPSIAVDQISISGSYGGASIDNLNKMVVKKLEEGTKSLNGVNKVESKIKNNNFTITLTLDKGLDKYALLNKVKDVITNSRSDLPSDMTEPSAKIAELSSSLLTIVISSNAISHDKMIEIADDLKTLLSSIKYVADIELYESTKRIYEIILDDKKIELYNLDKKALENKIKNISYIYPIGKIEDKKGHLFLSSKNGAKSVDELLNTLLEIDGKSLYLSDISKISKKYEQSDILSYLNSRKNIRLGLYKSEKANAIALSKEVSEKIKIFNEKYSDVTIDVLHDKSKLIKKRLNTVISGIVFGFLLVGIAIYFLINKRVAFIVVVGIPTAIIMGVVFLSLTSYSINMVTLIGVILVLGLLVDDAIIIAENIQRHISSGEDKLTSAIAGIQEVIRPILASSLTTIFAFIPMLMITGSLGEFIKMIPVAVVVLIIASLIDSFIFLPIHALHFLNKDDKELDWSKANALYKKSLIIILKYKKKFVGIFSIAIVLLTIILISNMRYQMFPSFDASEFRINGKFNDKYSIEEVNIKIKKIEDILIDFKEELGIKNISLYVGYRRKSGDTERKPSVFQFTIELHDRISQNFVDGYITPILSFDMDSKDKTRRKSLDEIVVHLSAFFKEYKQEGLEEISFKTDGAGITSNDIEILLSAKDEQVLLKSLSTVKEKLLKLNGIISVDDTTKIGAKELKIAINDYGSSLGFTESSVASILSSSYLKSTQTKGLDNKGIIEFITFNKNKDSLEEFESYEIQIPNTKKQIALKDIADFMYFENFDSMYKRNGQIVKSVVANVNNEIITATETLALLESTFIELENKGVKIILEGEDEQNKQMIEELSFALFLSVFLIFLTLLMMFDSFKYTLLILSLIPLSVTGAIFGHLMLGLNLSLTSIIGLLGLAGVVINDAIVMLDFIKNSKTLDELIIRATLRLRPILITSITTFLGLSTLIFFATGQSKLLQPLAVSLGFGLLWGTILTLLFLPALFAISNKEILKGHK